MGLSKVEIDFFGRLVKKGVFPLRPSVLEFGESHTVEDPRELLARLEPIISGGRRGAAEETIRRALASRSAYRRWHGPARALYEAIFGQHDYIASDIFPTPRALWANLNTPFNFGKHFDVVINNGTTEHIFNQANSYKVMHDHTKVGGLMVSWTPTMGYTNHGLFNIQPTTPFCLAKANNYVIEHIELATGDRHKLLSTSTDAESAAREDGSYAYAHLYFVFRKTSDAPFVVPMQDESLGTFDLADRYEKAFRNGGGVGWAKRRPANLALNKPAIQSSTSDYSWTDDNKAEAAGGNNGIITGLYGFHTDLEEHPWWRVDLGRAQSVQEVVVFNRLDSPDCAGRAASLYVAHSCDDVNYTEVGSALDHRIFGGADGDPFTVRLPTPVSARYIRVGLKSANYLHLDEIEVYAD